MKMLNVAVLEQNTYAIRNILPLSAKYFPTFVKSFADPAFGPAN